MSPIPTFDEEEISNNVDDFNLSSTRIVKENISNASHEQCNDNSNRNSLCINDNKTMESMEGKCLDGLQHVTLQKNNNDNENLNMKVIEIESAQECTESYLEESNSKYSPKPNDNVHRVHSVNAITLSTGDTDNSLPRDTSNDALSDARLTNNITQIAHINPELCGLPLELFTKVMIPDVFYLSSLSDHSSNIMHIAKICTCSRDISAYLTYLCPTWISWGMLMLEDI